LTTTFQYSETNDGFVPVSDVSVVGSACGTATYQSGDANGDGILETRETWVFTCTATFASPGVYTDTATAYGTNVNTGTAAPVETASQEVTVLSPVNRSGVGYWKSHPLAIAPLLPQVLGSYSVSNTEVAQAVLTATDCSNQSAQNAVGCLAGRLLSAALNIANGVGNASVYGTMTQSEAFLESIGYAGPDLNYSLTADQRSMAIKLAGQLASFG
jgi:hypothetical protein